MYFQKFIFLSKILWKYWMIPSKNLLKIEIYLQFLVILYFLEEWSICEIQVFLEYCLSSIECSKYMGKILDNFEFFNEKKRMWVFRMKINIFENCLLHLKINYGSFKWFHLKIHLSLEFFDLICFLKNG